MLSRYESLVEHTSELWTAARRPLPICVWTNHLKTSDPALLDALVDDNIDVDSVDWCQGAFRTQSWAKPGSTLAYRAGWYLVQEEIAMTAVEALDPQPTDWVLDLCAAPGNKTVQIASRVHPLGFVVANEWNTGRLSSLWNSVARMGVTNVATVNADGQTIPLPNHAFDRVLVDVPCSGEGTLRKHLRRQWSVTSSLKAIARIVPIQKRLLSRALDLVKPGGTVVYSTCTFAPEENEAVLDAVLGDRAVVEPFHIPGLHHAPGVLNWQGASFRADLLHAHRYYPHLNDTGGFFVARLRRTDAPSQSSSGSLSKIANSFHPIEPSTLKSLMGDRQPQHPLSQFCERFGIPTSTVQHMNVWIKGQEKLWLTDKSYTTLNPILKDIDVQNLGILLYRVVQGHLKPTTAALQRFGASITRNVIELTTPEQLQQFLAGQAQSLPLAPKIPVVENEAFH